MQIYLQMTLNGKCLIHELLVVFSLHCRNHENAPTNLVFGRTSGTAKHLQNFTDRVVDVSMLSAFEELRAHHNYQMSSEGYFPADVAGGKHDLDGSNLE